MVPTASNQKKRVRKHGGNDLEGENQIAIKKTVLEKITLIQQLEESMPVATNKLTQAGRVFWQRCIKLVTECLHNHHGSDVHSFCGTWDGCFKVKFSQYCCKGTGENCSGTQQSNNKRIKLTQMMIRSVQMV